MAQRLVRARPKPDRIAGLRDRLYAGDIEAMDPFGRAMTTALLEARYDPETGEAAWEEEDYCSPPLAMEREAVLDDYFDDLAVVEADGPAGHGWERIEHLPSLWDALDVDAPGA